MAVQGNVREHNDFSKEVGFFEGKVVAVNPDKEALEKLLKTTIEKEPEYLGEDDKGNTKLNLVFWLEDVKTGKLKDVRFFLKDTPRINKVAEGEDKVRKKQYINSVGITSWADKESNLQDWFTARDYRVANEGEEEMYKFILTWLNKLDLRDKSATVSFDWKKLMRGNVKEIADQIEGEYADTVVVLKVIKTAVKKDGDEEEKVEYEQVYNRDFLPGYTMGKIRIKKIDEDYIARAQEVDRKKRDKLQKFVLGVIDPEYGCKDYFILREVEPYDSSKNIVGTDETIAPDNTAY